MKYEYSELIEYLDEKFNTVGAEVAGVKHEMTELGQDVKGLDSRLISLEGKFDLLLTSADGYAKRADTYFQEMVVMAHKVERIERWLYQVADKVGVKLAM